MVEDFIICHDELEKHLGPHVDTLLWLEDDLVLMDNFFPSLTSIMTHGRGRLSRAPWLDIKLYLHPRLRGQCPPQMEDPDNLCVKATPGTVRSCWSFSQHPASSL